MYFSLEINDATLYIAHGLLICSLGALLMRLKAPYGRYSETNSRQAWMVKPTIGWLIQESPAFLIPFFLTIFAPCSITLVNRLVLAPFMLHYFFRSYFYPCLLTNGKPTSWLIVASAFIFCSLNGFLQGYYTICIATFSHDYFTRLNFILGVFLFLLGWGINIHSDFILKNLRKPGETGYKIPKGGLFEKVSCANYFGEILEWWGYALLSWSYPAFSFAIWSSTFLALRAVDHHRYYKQNLKGYPKCRKAVIPYLL